MISKEEMRAMTSREMEAYMRGYRDGQVDLREILQTNVIPVVSPMTTPMTTPSPITTTSQTVTWSYEDWKAYLNEIYGVPSNAIDLHIIGGDTNGEHQENS